MSNFTPLHIPYIADKPQKTSSTVCLDVLSSSGKRFTEYKKMDRLEKKRVGAFLKDSGGSRFMKKCKIGQNQRL